jgi:murein tripeptide amidase MpaA
LRPIFFIGATQHAREWIAPMTAMFLAQQLLDLYAVDPRVQTIMDNVDFRIVAVNNPDGYEYTWTTDRLWRKNRKINQGSSCRGVDLNRNWGYAWGLGSGSSPDPCSEIYRGTEPWSEPETAVLRDFISSLTDHLVASWDLHSYGQLVLEPWMYTTDPPPDSAYLQELGSLMAQAIAEVHGRHYTAGEGSLILYLAAGTAHDWVYGELGDWGIGIELRDTGNYGFVLPRDQIIPTGEEIFESLLRLNEHLLFGG